MSAATAASPSKFKISRFHLWMLFLATLMLGGVVAGAFVFLNGLQVTNLSDLVPWGLWITIDLSSIALSAGAFLLCAAVYLLGLKKYQPVARTATFIGLIGYSMAVLCLILDIGRPDRFWHALVYWNPHSLLWEVTMCVTLYFSVLTLETLPILGSADFMQQRWPGLSKRLVSVHKLAPFLAVAGLGFSMLHQSSLGAVYGILKAKPIWYSPGLSVLFMASAIVGGPSLTVLASMIASKVSPRAKIKDELLENVTKFIAWALVGYLYFRFWDAMSVTYTYMPGRNEGLAMLTKNSLSFNFWVGEIFLGGVVPLIILHSRLGKRDALRMLALLLIVGGIVAYRWDTNLVGQLVVLSYLPQAITARYTHYFPSLIEFMAGAGIVAYGVAAFTIGVRYLKIVNHEADLHDEAHETEAAPSLAPAIGD